MTNVMVESLIAAIREARDQVSMRKSALDADTDDCQFYYYSGKIEVYGKMIDALAALR